MPDIKDAGGLAGFVRWGNPHHGLLDGTTLADGGAGVSHPALGSYQQGSGLWITPAFSIKVPGLPVVALPAAVPGMEWHDYATFSGTRLAFYRTNIIPIPQKNFWVASFGMGDTWRVGGLDGLSVIPDAGGGTLTVSLTLTRFGQMQVPEDETLSISLTSNTIGAGQPVFTGGEDDFASSALVLQVMDISPSGNKVLLAAMPTGEAYIARYGAPRGLYLLELTRSAATLSLVKSRSDMLVSVVDELTSSSITGGLNDADRSCSTAGVLTVPEYNYNSVVTTTAINLIGAYFDDAGAIEYIRSSIVRVATVATTYASWTQTCGSCEFGLLASCTTDAQTVSSSTTFTAIETATLEKVVGTGVIASATSTCQRITAGSHTASGGSFVDTYDATESITQNSISGRSYTSTGPIDPATPLTFRAYPEYHLPGFGTFTRAPFEFGNGLGVFPISQVGLSGMLAHFSGGSLETSILTARHGVGGYTAAASSTVISVHPATGELAVKTGTWSDSAVPSFGWV